MRYIISFFLLLILSGCGGSSSPTLENIQISVGSTQLALGDSTSISVSATYSDNSKQTIENARVTFSSNSSAISIVQGQVRTHSVGEATITATFEGKTHQIRLTVLPAEVRAIRMSDNEKSIALGLEYTIETTATFSDGSTRPIMPTFEGFDSNIISVNEVGKVSTLAKGQTTITARYENITSSMIFTVTDAEPVSIVLNLTPSSVAAGKSSQAKVLTTFTDGKSSDTSALAELSSSSDRVVIDNATMQVKTLRSGTATITAKIGDLTDSETLTITNAVSTGLTLIPESNKTPLGISLALRAEASYSDETVLDVTSQATWISSNTDIAVVSSNGTLSSKQVGTVDISVSFDGFNASVQIEVTEAVLSSINVEPTGEFETFVGSTFDMIASGTYSDGSTRNITSLVTWDSSNTSIANVSNHSATPGQVTTIASGNTVISASLSNITSSLNLVVRELILDSIRITTQPLTDASTGQKGLSSQLLPFGGRSQNVESYSLPLGKTVQLYAIGTFENGDVADITNNVSWSVGNTEIAQLVDPTAQPGLIKGRSLGNTQVIASTATVQGSFSLTVTPALLEKLNITSDWSELFTGDTLQAKAEGEYSDGTIKDVTNDVAWQSLNPSIFTVSNNVSDKGSVVALSEGTANLSVALDGIHASKEITVKLNKAEMLTIATNDNTTFYIGDIKQFNAEVLFSNGTNVDVTSSAIWESLDPRVIIVGNEAEEKGKVTANNSGNAIVRASFLDLTAESTVVVSNPLSAQRCRDDFFNPTCSNLNLPFTTVTSSSISRIPAPSEYETFDRIRITSNSDNIRVTKLRAVGVSIDWMNNCRISGVSLNQVLNKDDSVELRFFSNRTFNQTKTCAYEVEFNNSQSMNILIQAQITTN